MTVKQGYKMQVWRHWDTGLAQSQLQATHPKMFKDPEKRQTLPTSLKSLVRKRGYPSQLTQRRYLPSSTKPGRERRADFKRLLSPLVLNPTEILTWPDYLKATLLLVWADLKANLQSYPKYHRATLDGKCPPEGTVKAKTLPSSLSTGIF